MLFGRLVLLNMPNKNQPKQNLISNQEQPRVYPKIPTHNWFIRYSGLISTLSFFLICVIVVALNFKSIGYTISYHVGLSLFSIISFAVVSVFSAICLLINMLLYAKKRWPFQKLIVAYAITLSVCLIFTGCFPYAPHTFPSVVTIIHRISAITFFIAPPIFALVFLILGQHYSLYYKIPFLIFLVKSIVSLFIFIFYTDMALSASLVSEALHLSGTITVSQVLSFAPNTIRLPIDKKRSK